MVCEPLFGPEPSAAKADNAKLLAAIKYRHDCVHQNGFTTDGIRLTVFTKAYVQEMADVMRSLVDLTRSSAKSTVNFRSELAKRN